ncbi:MAG: hypothetical protein IJO20_03865 [Ruminococcus sp.]|nr:hypothetical protein [Ruminococcus sp.]
MQKSNNENKLFIEACKKAGLKVRAKPGNKVAEGLVVVDSRGQRYTVDSNAVIQKPGIMSLDKIGFERRVAHLVSVRHKANKQRVLRGEIKHSSVNSCVKRLKKQET